MTSRREFLQGAVGLAALVGGCATTQSAAASKDGLYLGATLLEPAARQVLPDSFILVRDGAIAALGQGRPPRSAASAPRHDMRGLYALPGLIDTHAHLTLGPTTIDASSRPPRIDALADDAITAHNARMLLGFGVTSVRNPGGELAANLRYRADLAAGRMPGPAMRFAGEIMDRQPFAFEGLVTRVTQETPIDAIVAQQAAAGADYAKFYENLTADDLRIGIAAAKRAGLRTIAHLGDVSWTQACGFGVDSLVHMMPISPDLLPSAVRDTHSQRRRPGAFRFFEWYEDADLSDPAIDTMIAALKRANVTVDATLIVFEMAFWGDDEDRLTRDLRFAHPTKIANWRSGFRIDIGWKADDYARAKAVWPKVLAMTKKLADAGVKLTVGTDQGNPFVPPGISMWREMDLYAQAGLDRWDVLRMATADGADTLGWGERTGRLREGLAADIVFTGADPLADFAASGAQVKTVLADGARFDAEALRAISSSV